MPSSDLLLYQQTKAVVEGFLRSLGAGDLMITCAACPDWSVQDVAAHHIHALRSAVEGSLPAEARRAITTSDESERAAAGTVRDAWTASGVRERAGLGLEDLLSEWSSVMLSLSEDNARLILDLTVHFDDIRETLGDVEPRHAPDINRTLEYFYYTQQIRLKHRGLQPVRLECTDVADAYGLESGLAIVRGTAYDLLRCLASRRSREQASKILEWKGCSEITYELFPTYGWPT